MDEKPRRYRLAPDSALSPNDVVVGLFWKVNSAREVTDVVMSPMWNMGRVWPVASFCEAHRITLVRGEYSLTCDADGVVETHTLPLSVSDGMPQVCVGFIDSGESPFCEALNRMLADRFGKAIGLVERDIVTDHVTSTNAFASMLLDLSGKLAEFYGIECVTVTAR